MEETWEDRIPIECSTPKMLSYFGRQVENEIRRKSISLASGFKRKFSPQGDEDKLSRRRCGSSNDILQDIQKNPYNLEDQRYEENTKPEVSKDPFESILGEDHNHLEDGKQETNKDPFEDILGDDHNHQDDVNRVDKVLSGTEGGSD